MKKSIILSCVFAVALVGTLYSLPKVVVNTKGKRSGQREECSSGGTGATAPATPASETPSNRMMEPLYPLNNKKLLIS